MTIRKFAIPSICFAALGLTAMQFVRPALKVPPHAPLLQGAAVPPDIRRVFERACQDCHSNNTRWPWYARISPVSLLVAKDVNRGRKFLNLSGWQDYSKGRQLGYLASMSEAMSNRKMPPPFYSMMHPEARLTGEERKRIAAWARDERARVRSARR